MKHCPYCDLDVEWDMADCPTCSSLLVSRPAKSPGEVVIVAVIRAAVIREPIVEEHGTVIVWAANSAEQIEAALAEAGQTLVPLHVLHELVQHLTDCQALLGDARRDDAPDPHNEARLACIAKWRQQLAPGEQGPLDTGIPASPGFDPFAGFDPDEHELLVMDGYTDCIVGVVERYGQKPIVCYDREKVICRLQSEGMDRDDAEEFFQFNQIGAWMGDATPCFLSSNT